jgi:DNA-binding beta-propeller fold protein YncE
LLAATLAAGAAACATAQPPSAAPMRPAASYWVYVAAESADLLHRVRFGPSGAEVEHTVLVGDLPDETDGPHGLRISPDGRHLYMTTAHGLPTGRLWKLALGPDSVVTEPILLGRFPATLDVTPDGLYAVVANFNLHGEHEPSTLSTVYLPDLVEVAQTVACTMPHGVRISPDGRNAYTACMMDDRLVEMDTRTYRITRAFSVTPGMEGPIDPAEPHDMSAPCSPTWAQPSADGAHVYVTCNAADRILEISVADWGVTRTWETGRGPYNLTVSPDGGLLLATLRPGAGVQAVDLSTGQIGAPVPASGPLAHGVVVSPDGRYAFVTVEDVGMTPGKVDVFVLPGLTPVASVEVGQQAGGIAFWRMEP